MPDNSRPIAVLVPPQTEACHILLADDDHWVAEIYARILECDGYIVHRVEDGSEAVARLATRSFDAVISDIEMPGASGIDVLRAAHAQDPDYPVMLMTGNAALSTSVEAVEHGALRYLTKPVDLCQLSATVRDAIGRHKLVQLKQRVFELHGEDAERLRSTQVLHSRFDAAVSGLFMVYQPIVAFGARSVFGYEALLRTRDAVLPSPAHLLHLAEELQRIRELGRAVRRRVAEMLKAMALPVTVFVNLHPDELDDDELYAADAPLTSVAQHVVLEITERAPLASIADLAGRIATLRERGFRLAIDDLGAGYAGLSAFAQIHPDVIKLDMSLIRNVDSDPTRRTEVASLARMSRELGVLVVAEGVETVEERDTLVQLGCELLQGYLFAKPGPALPEVLW